MATSKSSKPVVKAEASAKPVVQSAEPVESKSSGWQPRPEDRAKANQLRIIAVVFWVLAIAVECVAIFGLILKPHIQVNTGDGGTVNGYPFFGAVLSQNAYFGWMIALIILAGILAVLGSLQWKKANRLDPASEQDKVRFFVQNQLGAIITLIAFIPLLILVIMDKNLKGAQKGIAVAIAALVLVGSTAAGTTINSPSKEQYSTEAAVAIAINGSDTVYWVKGGSVYHLCTDSPDLNRPSKDNQIYSGTVGQAHGAGKSRLAWNNECQCDNTDKSGTCGLANLPGPGIAAQPTDQPS